jgi:hypothetical protein
VIDGVTPSSLNLSTFLTSRFLNNTSCPCHPFYYSRPPTYALYISSAIVYHPPLSTILIHRDSSPYTANNQFARLRSPSQFATVQLLSSISVVIVFPVQMSRLWHKAMQLVIGYPVPWEEHADNVATAFYCRGLAQNVTMVGFLG